MHVALRRLKAQLWTYIRGVALPGEEPLIIWTPPMVFAATVASLIFSLVGTEIVWRVNIHSLDAFYIILFAIGQSAIFSFQQLQHWASHDSIFKSVPLNRLAAKLASIVSIGPNPMIYKTSHVQVHHNIHLLGSIADPDTQLILSLGLSPKKVGQERKVGFYYLKLIRKFLAVSFYLTYLRERVADAANSPAYLLSLLGYWLSIFLVLFATHWPAALTIYLMATIIGGSTSECIQRCTEHRWINKDRKKSKTFARLLPIDQHPERWLIYLYYRSSILACGGPLHLLHHHNKAKDIQWPMAAYSSSARTAAEMNSVWGINSHFMEALGSLS